MKDQLCYVFSPESVFVLPLIILIIFSFFYLILKTQFKCLETKKVMCLDTH